MPERIHRIYESALYVDDMDRAKEFYRDVLGLEVVVEGPRLVSLSAGGGTFLLLFKRGASLNGIPTPGGRIPPHDGGGPVHLALAIAPPDLPAWEKRLSSKDVVVESRVAWPEGGESLYFRDPEGHSVELAIPGIWGEGPAV
jgi:catechol 2,3-dioxygenase-like lactoylglutathione lyase family enzyme